jgi:hypothetical protein
MPSLYFVCNMHQTTVYKGVCFIIKKLTGKVVPLHAMEAHMGSGGTAPLILNLGTRCR